MSKCRVVLAYYLAWMHGQSLIERGGFAREPSGLLCLLHLRAAMASFVRMMLCFWNNIWKTGVCVHRFICSASLFRQSRSAKLYSIKSAGIDHKLRSNSALPPVINYRRIHSRYHNYWYLHTSETSEHVVDDDTTNFSAIQSVLTRRCVTYHKLQRGIFEIKLPISGSQIGFASNQPNGAIVSPNACWFFCFGMVGRGEMTN